jgi:phosphoribosyl-dephospho-CoA transferase
MPPEPGVHTLLRIAGVESLRTGRTLEPWVVEAIRGAPWVVVRRAEGRGDAIPVGVRGADRAQRCAGWIEAGAVLEAVTPERLAQARVWASSGRRTGIPALGALDAVEVIMRECGFADAWGPVGSIGFELASHRPTASASSDLDLVVRAERVLSVAAARALAAALGALSVRTDVLLETPVGAVSLVEYAGAGGSVVLRTRRGPRLVGDAWSSVDDGAGDRDAVGGAVDRFAVDRAASA